MDLSHIDLHQISVDIWSAILGLELKPNPAVEIYAADELVLTGQVQITGDWAGAVTVQCSERLARQATALMFGSEPDEVTDEEVRDTVGELANMTGGNVKSLLEGSCQLSLPTVTSGREYKVSILGTTEIGRMKADCDGELVVVTMLEQSA